MNLFLKATTFIGSGYGKLNYPQMPKYTKVKQPSATVLLTETLFSPTLEAYGPDTTRNGIFPAAQASRFPLRHNSGGTLNFLDGHAAFFKRSYITNGTPNDTGVNRAEKDNPDVIWDMYRN